jgi:sortase A
MKKKRPKWLLTGMTWSTRLIFIVSLCMVAYPIVGQAYSAYLEGQTISIYQKNTFPIGKAKQTAFEKKVAQQNDKITERAKRADSAAKKEVASAVVALNNKRARENQAIGKNNKPLGILSIPSLGGLRLPLYNNISDDAIIKGAGIVPGTSVPTPKKTGVYSMITAHSGLPTAKLFTDLVDLKLKDKFYVEINGKTLTYKVDHISVVKPEVLEKKFELPMDGNYVTLLTCTPTGINSHRLLVRGKLVSTCEQVPTAVREEFLWLSGLIAGVTLVGVLWARKHFVNRRK